MRICVGYVQLLIFDVKYAGGPNASPVHVHSQTLPLLKGVHIAAYIYMTQGQLQSIAHTFKIPAQILTIPGTCQHRSVLNMSVNFTFVK